MLLEIVLVIVALALLPAALAVAFALVVAGGAALAGLLVLGAGVYALNHALHLAAAGEPAMLALMLASVVLAAIAWQRMTR